jgi:hypothetical protein
MKREENRVQRKREISEKRINERVREIREREK